MTVASASAPVETVSSSDPAALPDSFSHLPMLHLGPQHNVCQQHYQSNLRSVLAQNQWDRCSASSVVVTESYCVTTQYMASGQQSQEKKSFAKASLQNTLKIAFSARSNKTVEKIGRPENRTSLFCLACKISSENIKQKGRKGVGGYTDRHT